MGRASLVALLLVAGAASAQEEEMPRSLQGWGRVSVQGGWRLTSNRTFYESYYGRPENQGLVRAPASPGGPVMVGSFAYAVTDLVELGVDLFATGERLQLTNRPTLTTLTYGAVVGLRFQALLEVSPQGLVPFLGVLAGSTAVAAVEDGGAPREVAAQMLMGSLGLTWRLSPKWGVTAEYRLSLARGLTPFENGPPSFSGGGHWLSLGLTHFFPPSANSRPFPAY